MYEGEDGRLVRKGMSPSSTCGNEHVASVTLYTQSCHTPDLRQGLDGADPIPRIWRLGAHGEQKDRAETAGFVVRYVNS